MFGIGGSEMIVILIIALIFLGPDKLPDAAKTISKGIRDLKRGSREIQETIENDERIGGAIRDIRSALRGEEPPPKRVKPKPIAKPDAAAPDAAIAAGAAVAAPALAEPSAQLDLPVVGDTSSLGDDPHDGLEPPKPDPKHVKLAKADAKPVVAVHAEASLDAAMLDEPEPAPPAAETEAEVAPPQVTLPPDAGEVDPDLREGEDDRAELAALIKPAAGTVAKGELAKPDEAKPSEPAATEPKAPASHG